MKTSALIAIVLLSHALICPASVITTYYGDDDGFGVGETSGFLSNVSVSHQGVGEAAFTDLRLIGGIFSPAYPDFAPTGGFSPFSIPSGETISQAVLTLRTGSFDSGPGTLNPLNRIFLDGVLVDPIFINGFSQFNGEQIETRSFSLPSSFFALFADGFVSLNQTVLSEASGSGSFQVDFLKLEIITTAVPEPSATTLLLVASGLCFRRRRTA